MSTQRARRPHLRADASADPPEWFPPNQRAVPRTIPHKYVARNIAPLRPTIALDALAWVLFIGICLVVILALIVGLWMIVDVLPGWMLAGVSL